MRLLDKMLARLVKKGELTVVDHDGRTYRYGRPDPELRPVTVRLTDRKVAFQIARDPALGTAEAWMNGRLLVEQGEIIDLVLVIRRNRRWEDRTRPNKFLRKTGRLRHRLATLNWKPRALKNVVHHYDIGNDLYRLFLDPDMQYSCAYFTDPGNSIEQAQLDKKAHIASKLYLKPGQKVLDLGCGWGGLALYLNRVADVDVLGVTLSKEQLAFARRRAEEAGVADRVKFELVDYRDVTGRFDRIVSIGMFEHLGTAFFPAFFRQVRDLLAPDGVALVHTMGRMGKPGTTDRFMQKYIFPGGYLPALSEIVSASEREKLIMADCEALRLHYVYTLRAWYERLKARREEASALADERFYRLWLFYLAASMTMFTDGAMVVYQLQYLRRRDATPITRDYMIEDEKRLRAKGA
ncbi:MAG: cyclopropane-fatty-acyl-phospholipid synthase [Sphingomonadales bacterium]|jgi:cyclopropane-fatty-acyl-phospholipid synthase|nr:cyclopropane-fatty-acyl-phospholipid synthase [Sphingomonadales bacterium]